MIICYLLLISVLLSGKHLNDLLIKVMNVCDNRTRKLGWKPVLPQAESIQRRWLAMLYFSNITGNFPYLKNPNIDMFYNFILFFI